MTEDEITAVLDKAHGCVEGECAVNDVDDLIGELKDQQKVLNERLETIMNVVSHLQHANGSDARKTDDVRAIVKDMLRVFTTAVRRLLCCACGSWVGQELGVYGTQFCQMYLLPSYLPTANTAVLLSSINNLSSQDDKFAIGFSGDIGDGATTAYDALPPKPWKASP